MHLSDLGTADFALYKSMQEWHNQIGDMLAYVQRQTGPARIRRDYERRFRRPASDANASLMIWLSRWKLGDW